ncbi:MAG: NAD(P)-dependent oxidoreductase [Thermodesulfobacteriota bacterium]
MRRSGRREGEDMRKTRIGFMGMGIMGQAMAQNLLRHGFPLTAYNRTPARCAILAELGAKVAATPLELARQSDVLIAMVSGPEAVYALLTGETGCARALDESKTFVNMGTLSPAYARELAHAIEPLGAAYVDAPVSGSKKPAEEGRLVILAGGDRKRIKALEPVFLAMGKAVVHCGGVGQGSMMKMAVNMLLGTMMQGLAEAAALARGGGLSLEALFAVLAAGPLQCDLFAMKEPMLKRRQYPAQFPLRHMLKDLRHVVDTAQDAGTYAPLAHSALNTFRAAASRGLGDADFAAVAELVRSLSQAQED